MRYKDYKGLFVHASTILLLALAWGGCSEQEEAEAVTAGPLQLFSSIDGFNGEEATTRVNVAGDAFVEGDRMRLKIICPFVSTSETGEVNDNGFDSFWLNKWTGSGWTNLTSGDGCDINGDGKASGSSNVQSLYLSQSTPYVFTASTWSQEVVFRTSDNKTVVQHVPVFHADQSSETTYRESDLLWAQTVMQTATEKVQLHFRHVMSALLITLQGFPFSDTDEVALTVEGMPDIDGAEVVVGDYYAAKSKTSNSSYGYKTKNSCAKDQNGLVLGIGVNDYIQNKAYTLSMTGNPGAETAEKTVENTGTYRALRQDGGTFRLIVPPCTLSEEPVVWVRSGTQRWKSQLEQNVFEQGTLYKLTITFPTPPADPDPGSDPDPGEETN